MSTAEEKFREDLTAHLLEVATGNGYLNGILLNTPDLDEAWQRYAPSFYPDAVREFNGYPEFCLACAGYLGMAVAHLWDKDWTKYRRRRIAFSRAKGDSTIWTTISPRTFSKRESTVSPQCNPFRRRRIIS